VRSHGTRARYAWGAEGKGKGCRCYECARAAWLYEKRRLARKARGVEPYVDAADARAHLEWLSANGLGVHRIVEVVDLSRSTLRNIKNGTTLRIRPGTHDRIMALHLGLVAPGAYVSSERTMRLLDELRELGLPDAEIARRLGYGTPKLQFTNTGLIRASNAAKVAELHRVVTAERDAQRQWAAERQADYRRRRDAGELNFTRSAS